MKRIELKKKINDIILPICKAEGFVQKNKSLMYYKTIDNVLNAILFDTRSTGYECQIFVQPLYISNDSLVLGLGDSVWRIDINHYKSYHLMLDMDESGITSNIESHAMFFQKTAFDWFDNVGSPSGICKYICSNHKESKIFYTPIIWKYEAKAYSELYLKNFSNAIKYYDLFVKELKEGNARGWRDVKIEEIEEMIKGIQTSPEIIHGKLIQTAKETRARIGIN
ncbi:MAG: hypothetical protein VB118_06115 [Oscillospiraceae bacterium]|nr:hypothetical protein [Oscillospiraceae bacterium]